NQKPDYAIAVTSARSSRISNAVFCTIGIALLTAIVAASFFMFKDYVLLCVSVSITMLIPISALLTKNLREIKAVESIAKTGTYAAKLSEKQQKEIRTSLVRQGRHFYLLSFLVIATPEAVVLVIMSRYFKSDLFLLIMAFFSLAAIALAALATMYLGARLKIKRAYSTVSSKGILTSREVLPFDAKKGDVISLIRFDDFYRIEFRKNEILGIRRTANVLIPTDGVLKNGIGGNKDEIIARTLGLKSITIIHSDFYESIDYSENTVNELAAKNMHMSRA
ncbi:MAG: hypothetical protein RSB78_06905, partial [Oscillospiraceae bacterium]